MACILSAFPDKEDRVQVVGREDKVLVQGKAQAADRAGRVRLRGKVQAADKAGRVRLRGKVQVADRADRVRLQGKAQAADRVQIRDKEDTLISVVQMASEVQVQAAALPVQVLAQVQKERFRKLHHRQMDTDEIQNHW
ncbi:MAG TPA: hypothetical protein PK304_02735, partial [Mobilitalea sp.]|nr:hypothetical protein [Mobilitalea sp.]